MTDNAQVREKAAWTVMVYLAGDNNLTDESVYAMTEMRKVGSGDGVNIVTQFDPRDDYLPTHRYHIGRKGHTDSEGRPIPLPDDIFDEVKGNNKFGRESKRARKHADVRSRARKAADDAVEDAVEAAIKEATHAAVKAATARGGQKAEPVIRTSLFDVLADNNIDRRETDTGSPITLYNFMSMCVELFPAHHYMVVLGGHGSGTSKDFLLRDDSPTGSLTINELKKAFKELQPELEAGQTIDILGMDVCLMSMAEVAYELRGLVKIMVGAESYSPASGWPYEPILKSLKALVQGTPDIEEDKKQSDKRQRIEYRFAESIVREYVGFYADYWLGGLSVDQSALDVTEVVELRKLINAFADEMTTEIYKEVGEEEKARGLPENRGKPTEIRRFRDALLLAHWEAQSYNGEQFVDLHDFCECLLSRYQGGSLLEKGRDLQEFIKKTFVLKSCYSGPVYQYSHGVSIYFPWSTVARDYRNLDFNFGRGGWERFLKVYTAKTRRLPRLVEGLDGGDADKREKSVSDFSEARDLNASILQPERFRVSQGKGPENIVRSMRNPPLVALPNECITEKQGASILEQQNRFFEVKKVGVKKL